MKKITKTFLCVIICVGITEAVFFLNYYMGFVDYPELSQIDVISVWASVLTIVFLIFSVLGLLQIDAKMKELTAVKEHLIGLSDSMKSELSEFKKSAKEERDKITRQATKEVANIINVSRKKQNIYDKLTQIANITAPDVRIKQYTAFLQNNQNEEGVNYAFVYICRGDAYCELEKPDKAFNDYEHAIQLSPEDDSPYVAMGCYYVKQKDYPKSIEYFEKALKLRPENIVMNVNIANSYAAMQQYDKAQKYYDLATDANPEQEEYYYNKALQISHSKEYTTTDVVENYYRHCLRLNPLFYKAAINLAGIYRDKNESEKAFDIYSKIIGFGHIDDFEMLILQRGICNRLRHRLAAALIDFNQVYSMNPYNVQNLTNLALTYFEMHMFGQAYEYLGTAMTEADKQNVHFCDGDLNMLKAELDKIFNKA